MRSSDGLHTINAAFVVGASINILYTLMTSYGEVDGLCGPEGVLFFQSPLIALMPLNYLIMLTGITGIVSPYVKGLIKRGFSTVDLKRIFLGMVASGGSVYSESNKYCIRFYSKHLVLHTIFADLAYLIYNNKSRTTVTRGSYVTQLYSKEAVRELKELSPEFKTRCGGGPSLSFVLEGRPEVKIEASRVLMSTSGWISCSFVSTNYGLRVYPRLGFGAALPCNMLSDCSKLMSDVSLKFSVYQDKRYDGRGYLATSDLMTMKKFVDLGGFIEGTKVKKGEFAGMEKNLLLVSLMQSASYRFTLKGEAIKKIIELGYDDELKVYLNRLMLG